MYGNYKLQLIIDKLTLVAIGLHGIIVELQAIALGLSNIATDNVETLNK